MPATNAHPTYVTTKEAAAMCNVTTATIYNWRKAGKFGVHHKSESGVNMYATAEILAASEGRERPELSAHRIAPDRTTPERLTPDDSDEVPNLTDEKAKHERAKRIKAELELERVRGSLVAVDDARRHVQGVAVTVRERVMGVVPKLAPVLAALEDQRDVSTALEEALREALTLLDGDLVGGSQR